MSDANAVPFTLFDTLSGKKRPLVTLEAGRCGVYCCGPTVYDLSHIGHGRAALVPDLLVRYLRSTGLDVKYVRNVTDIDDKIIARAQDRGITSTAFAEEFTQAYQSDMRALGMLDPDVEPKVTQHIDEILQIIARLIEKNMAYAVDGDVYFAVRSFPGYGKLSGRKLDDMRAGARVEVDTRKKDPMDFALWKGTKPGEPSWDSPWGPGRPGWHIECSAMSCKHLGESFEIHTGGRDLIFPHHENEIAQSQGACGESSFSRYWMHNGFVNFAGEKMSKSLGNFFTIREILALYHPEVLRYFLLSVHYRSPINFDVIVQCPHCQATLDEAAQSALQCNACDAKLETDALRKQVRFPGLEEADERIAYIYETLELTREFLERTPQPTGSGQALESLADFQSTVSAHLGDDLNTAAALGELSEALTEANRLLASKKGVDKVTRYLSIERFVEQFAAIAELFGTFGRNPAEYLLERRDLKAKRIGLDVERVEALVKARVEARAAKDFTRADEVRAELDALHVKIRDGAGGSIWTL